MLLHEISNVFRSEYPKLIIGIIWFIINIVLFTVNFIRYKTSIEYYYLNELLGSGLWVARASASCLNFNCMLLLLPVCRNLINFWRKFQCRTSIRRQLDNNITFHKFVAFAICLFTILHYYAHDFNFENFLRAHKSPRNDLVSKLSSLGNAEGQTFINPIRTPNTNPILEALKSVAGITGIIMIMILIIIISSSTKLIRHSYYEVFWFTHHFFVLFYVGLLTHGLGGIIRKQSNTNVHDPKFCKDKDWGDSNPKCPIPQFEATPISTWKWIILPIILYGLERVVRFIKSLYPDTIFKVIKHPSNVVELRFNKNMDIMTGEYVLIKCMKISILQWHPFTITSAPNDNFISIHVRVNGDWTEKLYNLCTAERQITPKVSVDGPFGTATGDVFNYKIVVIIGAGIGITPFASVLKHIQNEMASNATTTINKVYFFWICNSTNAFEWFNDLLLDLEKKLENILIYNIYLTKWNNQIQRDVITRHEDVIDPITGLTQKTFYGRPNWKNIFEKLQNAHLNDTVGVFCCGPNELCKDVRDVCLQMNETKFTFNKEHF